MLNIPFHDGSVLLIRHPQFALSIIRYYKLRKSAIIKCRVTTVSIVYSALGPCLCLLPCSHISELRLQTRTITFAIATRCEVVACRCDAISKWLQVCVRHSHKQSKTCDDATSIAAARRCSRSRLRALQLIYPHLSRLTINVLRS